MNETLAIIIPTYQAEPYFLELCHKLKSQSLAPSEIIVVDSSSSDATVRLAREAGCIVKVIPQTEFNHGGTRNLGARLSTASLLVFMTQDAIPANDDFLACLVEPLQKGTASAAFARQLPYEDASPPEAFARSFNYPEVSRIKSLRDLPELGIKTFFFSDVASAVRRDDFESVGCFPEDMILNEDMLLSARLMRAGKSVAYQGDAQVFHSHNYGIAAQFRRYFDIGVSISRNKSALYNVKAGGEGQRFILTQIAYLIKKRAWSWIPQVILEAGAKFIAFQLGMRENKLPGQLKQRISLHPLYWK